MELAKIPDVLGAHKLCEAARRLFGNVVLIPEELGGERFSRRNFCRIPLLVQPSWHQMHRRLWASLATIIPWLASCSFVSWSLWAACAGGGARLSAFQAV